MTGPGVPSGVERFSAGDHFRYEAHEPDNEDMVVNLADLRALEAAHAVALKMLSDIRQIRQTLTRKNNAARAEWTVPHAELLAILDRP